MINTFTAAKIQKILISQKRIDQQQLLQLNAQDRACYVKGSQIYWWEAGKARLLANLEQIPIALNGYAKHNVENTLHAIAICYALGVDLNDIVYGLPHYENDVEHNQGRTNVYTLRSDATVIIDFAHNPASLDAILSLAQHYCDDDSGMIVITGATGDRLNLIDACAKVIMKYQPQAVIIKELQNYLRGSKKGEIPHKIAQALKNHGALDSHIHLLENEYKGAKYVLENLKSNDVCVLCCHEQITAITTLVRTYI